jgi:hypothetical protein
MPTRPNRDPARKVASSVPSALSSSASRQDWRQQHARKLRSCPAYGVTRQGIRATSGPLLSSCSTLACSLGDAGRANLGRILGHLAHGCGGGLVRPPHAGQHPQTCRRGGEAARPCAPAACERGRHDADLPNLSRHRGRRSRARGGQYSRTVRDGHLILPPPFLLLSVVLPLPSSVGFRPDRPAAASRRSSVDGRGSVR